jgi:hypothetical protein
LERDDDGMHTDFTHFWYKDTGITLISAMIFNIYWPLVEFFGFYMLRSLKRVLDRGLCSCSAWKTKANTI